MKNKRFLLIAGSALSLLLLPLIAMQFTSEVNWRANDFLVIGILLLLMAIGCEFTLRKFRKPSVRFLFCLSIVALFIVVWAEMAVGVFGTPIAGH